MHGNAQEWCFDAWSAYPKDAKQTLVDPVHFGDPAKDTFVVHGGAWWMTADACTSSWRDRVLATPANGFRGFRVVLGMPLRKRG
jgi:formylglycine-generating enzyme required for sulfatase activity